MAAKAVAEKTAANTKKAAEAFAIEIKATPRPGGGIAKQAVNKSVDDTKQQVTSTVKDFQAYSQQEVHRD
jgi:hypothetical protein